MSDVIPFPVIARPRPAEPPAPPPVKTAEQKAAFQKFADAMRRKYGWSPRRPATPQGLSDQEEIEAIERMIDTALRRLADLRHSRTKLEFWLSARIAEHFAEE